MSPQQDFGCPTSHAEALTALSDKAVFQKPLFALDDADLIEETEQTGLALSELMKTWKTFNIEDCKRYLIYQLQGTMDLVKGETSSASKLDIRSVVAAWAQEWSALEDKARPKPSQPSPRWTPASNLNGFIPKVVALAETKIAFDKPYVTFWDWIAKTKIDDSKLRGASIAPDWARLLQLPTDKPADNAAELETKISGLSYFEVTIEAGLEAVPPTPLAVPVVAPEPVSALVPAPMPGAASVAAPASLSVPAPALQTLSVGRHFSPLHYCLMGFDHTLRLDNGESEYFAHFLFAWKHHWMHVCCSRKERSGDRSCQWNAFQKGEKYVNVACSQRGTAFPQCRVTLLEAASMLARAPSFSRTMALCSRVQTRRPLSLRLFWMTGL